MKKAVVTLWISLFFAFLTIVLLLSFYFIFIQGSNEPEQIGISESYDALAHTVLANYLQSQVTIGTETMTFADLIRLAQSTSNNLYDKNNIYVAAFHDKTNEYLKNAPFTAYGFGPKPTKFGQFLVKTVGEPAKISQLQTASGTYALLVYQQPPGERGTDLVCIDVGSGACRDKNTAFAANPDISKAGAFVPLGNQKTLYVALIIFSSP